VGGGVVFFFVFFFFFFGGGGGGGFADTASFGERLRTLVVWSLETRNSRTW